MFIKVSCILVLCILSYWDIKYYIVPNTIVLSFAVFLVSYSISGSSEVVYFNYINVIFFGSLFGLISFLTHGLGMGDVKVLGLIAFVEDFLSVCLIGISASLIGILILVTHNVVLNKKLKKIPFVPCLTVAFFATELLKVIFICKTNVGSPY